MPASLDAGDYDCAAAVYDELARKRNAHFKVVGLAGVAAVAMRRGDLARAVALFGELRGNRTRVPPVWTDIASEYLAMCHAVSGNVERADSWLDDSETLTPITATAYAVVGCRDNRLQEVAGLAAAPLRRVDARLFSHEVRVFHLMRAFAKAACEEPVADDLMYARPAFAGELDYLTADWPALRDFIARHPLPALGVAEDAELPTARVIR